VNQVPAAGDGVAAIEQWRRTVDEHVPGPRDKRRCVKCGGYWPCWEMAYAREQLIVNGLE
jgi:hypothetical protein